MCHSCLRGDAALVLLHPRRLRRHQRCSVQVVVSKVSPTLHGLLAVQILPVSAKQCRRTRFLSGPQLLYSADGGRSSACCCSLEGGIAGAIYDIRTRAHPLREERARTKPRMMCMFVGRLRLSCGGMIITIVVYIRSKNPSSNSGASSKIVVRRGARLLCSPIKFFSCLLRATGLERTELSIDDTLIHQSLSFHFPRQFFLSGWSSLPWCFEVRVFLYFVTHLHQNEQTAASKYHLYENFRGCTAVRAEQQQVENSRVRTEEAHLSLRLPNLPLSLHGAIDSHASPRHRFASREHS